MDTSRAPYDIQKRAVHVYLTVVINEAQLTKLIHEETDERTRGADHLRERFLADLCNDLSLAITSGNVWANP
jgi:hypothetical protein